MPQILAQPRYILRQYVSFFDVIPPHCPAYQEMLNRNLTCTEEFHDILQERYGNWSKGNLEDILPNRAELARLADCLTDPDNDRNYEGLTRKQKASLKHAFKNGNKYCFEPATRKIYAPYTSKQIRDGSAEKAPKRLYTPVEMSYSLIAQVHVDADGKHLNRDHTWAKVVPLSYTIKKEVVWEFVRACPGCRERVEQYQKLAQDHKEDRVRGGRGNKGKRKSPSPETDRDTTPDNESRSTKKAKWLRPARQDANVPPQLALPAPESQSPNHFGSQPYNNLPQHQAQSPWNSNIDPTLREFVQPPMGQSHRLPAPPEMPRISGLGLNNNAPQPPLNPTLDANSDFFAYFNPSDEPAGEDLRLMWEFPGLPAQL